MGKKTRMSTEKKEKFYWQGYKHFDENWCCPYTENSLEEYYWWQGWSGRRFMPWKAN